jgi:hypothetical protein
MNNKPQIEATYAGYFPEIPKLSLRILARACRVKPKKKDILNLFNCKDETLEHFCTLNGFLSFEHFRVVHSTNARDMLMQKAIDLAMEGDRQAMRLCLINLCGWADSVDQKLQRLEQEISNMGIEEITKRLRAVASTLAIEEKNEV